jgi:CHAT domain-containing protein
MGNYANAAELKEEASQLNMNLVNRNFSFLSEQQRGSYWETIASVFEGAYSLSHVHPIVTVNTLNYNNTLFSKGLLLRTTNAVRDAILNSGNAALVAQYEELGRLREQISRQQQNNGDRDYIQSLETRADTLDKSLAQASAEFRALQADMALGWQDVQKALEPGEATIEFVSFRLYDKGWTDTVLLAALVLRPGMEAPVWVPLCEAQALQEHLAKTKDKDSTEQARILYDESGALLYRLIWQPLEKELAGVKTIYYSPSGLLHKISFNAIPVTEDVTTDNSRRLADIYDLNLVSSTREVAHRDRTDAPALTSAAIYGGLLYDVNAVAMRQAAQKFKTPDGTGTRIASAPRRSVGRGGTWGYLVGTDKEVWAIRDQVKARNIPNTLYNGREGNEETFKQLDGAKTGLIHLATHGFFLEDIEEKAEDRDRVQRLGGGGQKAVENPLLRSGLILAGGNNAWNNNPVEGVEDGILTADEIARLNLTGTRLVVLSACQTGLGDVNNREGVFGLQRAFKLAGVETLIMSLWNVDDKTTADLMTAFYEGWLLGKGKQEAFKEAQGRVRAKNPAPYYWAAFVIMD